MGPVAMSESTSVDSLEEAALFEFKGDLFDDSLGQNKYQTLTK